MVAYSFQAQFIGPIRAGLGIEHLNERGKIVIPGPKPKLQTIRAIGKRRHARPGETLQLYYAMRTRQCFKIGEARCTEVADIRVWPYSGQIRIAGKSDIINPDSLNLFARADGFVDWADMRQFWLKHHPGVHDFSGVLIRWKPL